MNRCVCAPIQVTLEQIVVNQGLKISSLPEICKGNGGSFQHTADMLEDLLTGRENHRTDQAVRPIIDRKMAATVEGVDNHKLSYLLVGLVYIDLMPDAQYTLQGG